MIITEANISHFDHLLNYWATGNQTIAGMIRWGPLKVHVQRICNLVYMMFVMSSTRIPHFVLVGWRICLEAILVYCWLKFILSETTNANDLHLGTNDAFAYFKDSSFHLDRVKNIATMGNSCFWLVNIILILSESISSNGLLIVGNDVFEVFCFWKFRTIYKLSTLYWRWSDITLPKVEVWIGYVLMHFKMFNNMAANRK